MSYTRVLCLLLILVCTATTDPKLSEHSLPVYGNASLGYYYVKVFAGHPPQQQTVIIDTGSGQFALPCNKCANCNLKHLNPPFDMHKSKTAQYVTCQSNDPQCKNCKSRAPTQQCNFSIYYAEGSSLEGNIIQDTIQFQSDSQGQEMLTTFGCTTKQTNLFLKQQANGIFGLSPRRTSKLLEDIYKKHHAYSGEQLEFSLCLTGNGGLLTIGGVNKELHTSQQSIKTSYNDNRNLYSLNAVKEIKLGNQFIHNKNQLFSSYGVFIDSGSTFTYFPKMNYMRFKTALLKQCEKSKEMCQIAQGQSTLCFHLTGDRQILSAIDSVFSPITFQINNKVMTWKPQKYFLLRDKINRQICLGVQSLDRFLLGANWMVDSDVVFNLKEKYVEIFQNSNCLKQTSKRVQMSQYTQKVEGHKPLSYQTPGEHLKNEYIYIVIGVACIVAGIIGLLAIMIKRRIQYENYQRQSALETLQEQDTQNEIEN